MSQIGRGSLNFKLAIGEMNFKLCATVALRPREIGTVCSIPRLKGMEFYPFR